MARKESKKEYDRNFAKIKVVGVGGGGGNAVSRMNEGGSIRNVEFIAVNTDAQDLEFCGVRRKIHIGKNVTKGLGAGMNPEIGRQAAEENRAEISEALKGADMVFITAGFGGGTGSGASPIIAEIARETGALTVAVVTKPFIFEGSQRARIAQEAIGRTKDNVDTLIVIPNDRIFSLIDKDTPILKAFKIIDDVLRNAVQGVAELITTPGIINVDFADVKAIMKDAGSAIVGIGLASGPDRAITAVNQAVNSPLLEISVDGAKGVLFGVSGCRDLTMSEINDMAKIIAEAADPSARIIFGAYHDRKLKAGRVKITLIATGFNGFGAKANGSLFTAPAAASSSLLATRKEEAPKEAARNENDEEKKELLPEKSEEKEKSDDVWDIPTFLRKKKR
ncbi:MAG: cell division protein FtsZ [Parcubacteria group bacterium]|nr:cell division protein FtsZ [Parcubacteria group bacterium]